MAKERKQFDFIGKRKIFLIIAACFLGIGIIFNVIFGTELDTNFKGGTIFTYSYTGDISEDSLKGIASEVLGNNVAISFSKDLSGDKNQVTMTLTDIPATVLTYSYTADDGAAAINDSAVVEAAKTALDRDVTVNTEENGKLVITPSGKGRVTNDQETALTDALTSAFSGNTFTLDSDNSVNDIADLLMDRLVNDFGTKLVFSYAADSVDSDALKSDIQNALSINVNVNVDADAKTVTVVPTDSAEKDGAFTAESKNLLGDIMNEYGLSLTNEQFNSIELITSNSVKPTVGRGFFIKCLFAMIIGAIIITVYISLRFRRIGGLSAAVFATFALIHDVLISYFVYVVFRIPLDDNFIAVVLTILGYSINGTIVVYDRIRSNERKYGSSKSINEIVNMSVNGVLTRNIYTTLSTFIAVATVCIVAWLRGLDSIISFAFPMSIGILAGFYSSLLLSSPMWAWWRVRREQKHSDKTKKK